MIKTKGKILYRDVLLVNKTYSACFLKIELPALYFDVVEKHIINNMFISVKRLVPEYRKILISSVGDSLNTKNQQNLLRAEVAIESSIEPLSQDLIKKMNSEQFWDIIFINKDDKNQTLYICVDKETEFIIQRDKLISNSL